MGAFWVFFLPPAFGFGWFMGQSTWLRSCPKCGTALVQSRSLDWAEQRRTWLGIALANAISLILFLASYWLSRPAPMTEIVPPPVALPKGPPA